jgi:hypothetical protein
LRPNEAADVLRGGLRSIGDDDSKIFILRH